MNKESLFVLIIFCVFFSVFLSSEVSSENVTIFIDKSQCSNNELTCYYNDGSCIFLDSCSENEYDCSETDGGNDSYEMGVTYYSKDTCCMTPAYLDHCEDWDNLIEYYCVGDAIWNETIFCPDSCISGACINQSEIYADQPESWLVLYSLNSSESVEWAEWYQYQRGIPDENMLGLSGVSEDEHLYNYDLAKEQILAPVKDYLTNNTGIRKRAIGILLGYRMPGHHSPPPISSSVGGWSIASNLMDLSDDELSISDQKGYNWYNPQFEGNNSPVKRLSKADLEEYHFMVSRIDAPTLELAKELTLRAKAIEEPEDSISSENVYYDYSDSVLPSGIWEWCRKMVIDDVLDFPDVPWVEFDADSNITNNTAIRIGTHDVDGWNDSRLYGEDNGSKILAFNYNSWGATTARDNESEGGRYVPNAISAGYASVFGSTGEPNCCIGLLPGPAMAALQSNWTIAEAYFLGVTDNDWMWTLFGDPLMKVPSWF